MNKDEFLLLMNDHLKELDTTKAIVEAKGRLRDV